MLDSGAHMLLLTQPLGYESDAGGELKGLRIARTELGAPDSSGRRRPKVIPGTQSVLTADMVIEAIGQTMAPEVKTALSGIDLTPEGLVAVKGKGSFATSVERVFAAGDIVNGGTTAVQGVAEGLQAAAEMDRFFSVQK
jgi:glutamate synthase (NADPH/NADH) small chain